MTRYDWRCEPCDSWWSAREAIDGGRDWLCPDCRTPLLKHLDHIRKGDPTT